jgi:hypothetical protein
MIFISISFLVVVVVVVVVVVGQQERFTLRVAFCVR